MMTNGKILIADDEETFLISTSALLTDEGYECATASNAADAATLLRDNEFDLLIADIKMPGNAELELVHELPILAEGMPVILVTGYPTVNTAIQSIRLPVVAYLIKPVDFGELLAMVHSGVEYTRVHRAVKNTRSRLGQWEASLHDLQRGYEVSPKVNSAGSVDSFLKLAHDNIMRSFGDLLNVSRALANQSKVQFVCHLANCPKLQMYEQAIENTVKTLERTKSAFKSKELGDLRKKLEELLESERRAESV
ncbi:MAG TPA: response regulator [bacterium]|jgi:YesN/AraC family two-component response regulator